uniref:Uncharacterized protein n=1 Tax=Anopheles epiroticus TaxID=199890 RepID=A0A182PB66_9DIPT
MGSLNSKVTPTAGGKSDQENGQYLNPRSPTLHINRSPISTEQAGVSRSSVTKVKDLTAALTETSDHTLRTPYSHLLPKRFQSIVDPRSPSTFDRTPIVFYPDTSVDCSLTNVVSSLQYEELTNEPDADVQDESFKDCDPEIPEMCNLQIENDESEPILETPGDEKEVTIFEDAEVTPFAGNDPRSPCIAIARTPMVLVKQDEEEEEPVKEQHNQAQVANLEALQADLKAEVKKQEHTPKQGIQDCHGRGEQTPKKDKQTPTSGIKAGNRTPLGCVTNIGTGPQNIRKMALIGQIKQGTVITDEQKLISRVGGNTGSAGLNTSGKQTNRSRIPKLRMS